MALDLTRMQVLAKPVSSYYEGRAIRNAEAIAQKQGQLLDTNIARAELENEVLRNPQEDPKERIETAKAALDLLQDFEAQAATAYKTVIDRGGTSEEAQAAAQPIFIDNYRKAKSLGLYNAVGARLPDDGKMTYDFEKGLAAMATSTGLRESLKSKDGKPPTIVKFNVGETEYTRQWDEKTQNYVIPKVEGISGDISGPRSKGTTVSVNLPQEQIGAELREKLGKNMADRIDREMVDANDASVQINSTREARELLKQGIITGTAGNIRLEVGRALATVGLGSGEGVARTDAYLAATAGLVAKVIKQFGAGTGLSDADREYAAKMAAGKIELTAQSMEKILDINERAAKAVIKRYNKTLNKTTEEFPEIGKLYEPIEVAENTGPVEVKTPADAMKLPSGTQFITPDGRVKVRP